MLGMLWALVPFLMIAKSVVRYGGFVEAVKYLVIFTGVGVVIFLVYWMLAVRQNDWWIKDD